MLTIPDRPLTPGEAATIAGWRYDPPYGVYDGDGGTDHLGRAPDEPYGYYPVLDDDELIGFVCFGQGARVRGQQEELGTCDIGAGIRPDRLSQRLGTQILPLASEFAAQHLNAARLRVAIALFNERSQRLCTSARFTRHRTFDGPGGRQFVELVRQV